MKYVGYRPAFMTSFVGLKSFNPQHICRHHKSSLNGTKLVSNRRFSFKVGRKEVTTQRVEGGIGLVLEANLSSPKKKLTIFTFLGVSCMLLLGKPAQAAMWKPQSGRTVQHQAAFIQVKSDNSFDEKFLKNDKVTELPAADYLESCVDRDFQYTFDWSRIHEVYTLLGSVAFLVTFNILTALVDNFIQQQERKEVQEEMERFGRFLSPKTEYRDDVSLDKVDINMWKAQQRERSFYGREFSAQDMFEDKDDDEDETEGGSGKNEQGNDDGDVDYKNLERLLNK